MRMASRYGHTWVSQYGASPAGIAAAEWRSTLAGVTSAQFREGFDADKSRCDAFPPSSTQFLSMCLGIPTLASVTAEITDALSGKGHPIMSRFARGTYARLDTYTYRNSAEKYARNLVRDAYELTRDFVVQGGTLPVDPVGLIEREKPKHNPASPETVQEHLAKVRAKLREPEPEADHDDAA